MSSHKKSCAVASVANEFERLPVDIRIRKRIRLVIDRLCEAPDLGFPRALKTERESEGFYRLLNNRRLTYASLVSAHAEETLGRIPSGETIRIVHDTTEFSFGGEHERVGLGRTRTEASAQGFFAHLALATTADATRRPLGVVGAHCWARGKKSRGNRRMTGQQLAKIDGKESDRWRQLVEDTEELVRERASAVHLMDREGDSYALFATMVSMGARFVVRMAKDRVVFEEEGVDEVLRLSEALVAFPELATREVAIGKRVSKPTPRSAKSHPPRVERTAKLAFSAGTVTLKRPRYLDETYPESLTLNVAYVREVNAPTDAEPVSWVLVTSEPVRTAEEVEAVVDHYRSRWIIEEFFKALKTGCAFEERQLESFASLTNALALFFPIAWQMLLVRTAARQKPDAPAETVFTATQIKVLRHCQPQKMPLNATVLDALYAVAGQGDHLKQNGYPRWRTLAYGMQDIIKMAAIWDASARDTEKTQLRSDQ